jgi:hypothetical protein
VTVASLILSVVWGVDPAGAFNEAERLGFAYFRLDAGTTALDTEVVIGNNEGGGETANIKCFNDNGVRVGPGAGTNVVLSANDAEVVTLEHLEITTDPNFTGVGWCFVRNTTPAGDLGVSVIVGLQGAGLPANTSRPAASRILGSDASTLVATDVGQGMYTINDASLPNWTHQGSWLSFLLAINPRQVAGSLNLEVFDMAGGLLQDLTGVNTLAFPARAMVLRAFPAGSGHADMDADGGARLFGYYFAANLSSLQAMLGQVTLDNDDTLGLGNAEITAP